jgi:hypothetical protein
MLCCTDGECYCYCRLVSNDVKLRPLQIKKLVVSFRDYSAIVVVFVSLKVLVLSIANIYIVHYNVSFSKASDVNTSRAPRFNAASYERAQGFQETGRCALTCPPS